ncbi:MAG: hypothetical protein FWE57_04410, partial [Chitinispirillia bacterium]|nr:hypothetical protein [Chitinispirillia bacterium]
MSSEVFEAPVLRIFRPKSDFVEDRLVNRMFGFATDTKELVAKWEDEYWFIGNYDDTELRTLIESKLSLDDTRINQWNTAYSWGNHASVGYLTELPAHNHDASAITSGVLSIDRIPALNINEKTDGLLPWSRLSDVP